MCGINGIIHKNLKPSKSEIYKMNYSIKHRGPDGSGVFEFENVILGHVRLAILDLSSKGKQPMSCDERYWITFNGEIYNFKSIQDELKKLGYKFFSKTDTGSKIGPTNSIFCKLETSKLISLFESVTKNIMVKKTMVLKYFLIKSKVPVMGENNFLMNSNICSSYDCFIYFFHM